MTDLGQGMPVGLMTTWPVTAIASNDTYKHLSPFVALKISIGWENILKIEKAIKISCFNKDNQQRVEMEIIVLLIW